MIAGHTFAETPNGRACSSCGKRWLDVLRDREFWRQGERDIAHTGALTATEVAELNAELERVWATVAGEARA